MFALPRYNGFHKVPLSLLKRYQSSGYLRWGLSTPSILTLDPTKIQTEFQSAYDISERKAVPIALRAIGGPSTRFRFRISKDPYGVTEEIPFPPNTRGIFYYYRDPKLPPISGGIRFRLCDSCETFDQGQDLHTSVGKPWNVPLLRILTLERLKPLARFLVEGDLVEKGLIQDLRQLKFPTRFRGIYLHHLSQPLVVDLEATALTFHLTTRKSFSSMLFSSPFYNTNKACSPYSGIINARFELSTLPEHSKIGPTLVLRILDFLSPVQRTLPSSSGPYIEVASDTLAMRRTKGGLLKPWAYPIKARSDCAKWTEFLSASSSS